MDLGNSNEGFKCGSHCLCPPWSLSVSFSICEHMQVHLTLTAYCLSALLFQVFYPYQRTQQPEALSYNPYDSNNAEKRPFLDHVPTPLTKLKLGGEEP